MRDAQRATIDTDVMSTPGGMLPKPGGVGVCSNAIETTEHPWSDMYAFHGTERTALPWAWAQDCQVAEDAE
jgi:hypothetical protein